MNKPALIVTVVVLLLIVGTTWAFWPRSGVDPKVKAILQKQAQMNGRPTPEQFQAMQAEEKDLTDEQRQQVRQARFQRFQRQRQREAAAYCALSAEQRAAYLDKKIEEQEKFRQQRAAYRQQNGGQGGPGGGGGPNGGPGGGGPGDGRQGGSASGQGGGQGGGPGGPRGYRDPTGQQRVQRMATMMDNSTPVERAQMQQYMSDLSNRRQQLGVSGGGFY